MADQIFVESLELSSVIGVPDAERARAQRLTASLTLEPLRDFRGLDDAIENAVDYFTVTEFVKDLSLSRPRRLIETLADEIATALIARFPLRAVHVELRKFILPDTAFVAVRVHRERSDGSPSLPKTPDSRMKKPPLPKLIVADSDHDADILYATRFFAPDPFLFLEKDGRTCVVLSDLEIDRGRRDAAVDEVIAYSDVSKLCKKGKDANFAEHALAFLNSRKVKRAAVPGSFPLGLAQALEKGGITLVPEAGLFWKEREFKTAEELKQMRRSLIITEAGMARGIEVLKAAEAGPKNALRWNGRPLTAEILRAEIDSAILRAGGLPANTIVAGGDQACDPHERGSGPLRAHELIILDIFPRDARTGYFGDMTRTVIRGRASDAQRRLWETCLSGQKQALKAIKPGVEGKSVQADVKDFFTGQGYPTEQREGRWTGFFHGLGHGLGLEIHESPRIAATTFQHGQVVTVEPGIYVPGIGGVRHEDVITITETGHQLLSRFPKELEI